MPQQVLVTRAHVARTRFFAFARVFFVSGVGAASGVRLAAVKATGDAFATLSVGAAGGLSARDKRADASAAIAVSIAVITHIRPSINSRPSIFMVFLSAKRRGRTVRQLAKTLLSATHRVAIARARVTLWDVAYSLGKDVVRGRIATAFHGV